MLPRIEDVDSPISTRYRGAGLFVLYFMINRRVITPLKCSANYLATIESLAIESKNTPL